MSTPIETVARHGVVRRQELLAAGMTRTSIQSEVATGTLIVVSRGLYRTADCPDDVRTAVAAGATLTCMSALKLHGITPMCDDKPLHIRRPRHRRRAGEVEGTRECPGRGIETWPPADSIERALAVASAHHDVEEVVAAFDAVLNAKLRTRAELEAAFAEGPAHARYLLEISTGLAESALESVARLRLRALGIKVKAQHHVPGAGHFDLLVGRRLLVELDGFEYHRDRKQFREDRRRDRRAAELGYTVLRFTWEDIMHDWRRVEATILGHVQKDAHRRLPRAIAQ